MFILPVPSLGSRWPPKWSLALVSAALWCRCCVLGTSALFLRSRVARAVGGELGGWNLVHSQRLSCATYDVISVISINYRSIELIISFINIIIVHEGFKNFHSI